MSQSVSQSANISRSNLVPRLFPLKFKGKSPGNEVDPAGFHLVRHLVSNQRSFSQSLSQSVGRQNSVSPSLSLKAVLPSNLILVYLSGAVLKLSCKRVNSRPYTESQDINQQKRTNKEKKAAIFNNLQQLKMKKRKHS